MSDQTRRELRRHPAAGRRGASAAVLCAALVAAACGSSTSRDERSAGTENDTDTAAPAAAVAPAPDMAASDPSPETSTPDTPPPAAADAGLPSPKAATPAKSGSVATGAAVPAKAAEADRGSKAPAASAPAAQRPRAPEAAAPQPGAPQPGAPQPGSPEAGLPQPGAPASGPKSDIVFGSFGIESGVVGAVTASAPPGIRAWAADVNARGGLNGHPVRVVMADDGGDTARAQAIVRKMVERDHAIAIFYPYGFTTAEAVLPYLESKGVPMLGHLSVDPGVEKSPIAYNPFMSGGIGMAWNGLLTMTTQTDKRKFGFLYCREVASCAEQKDAMKSLLPYDGLELVWEGQVSLVQPDYTAECLAAQRAGVEVVMLSVEMPTAARFIRSCRRQNYNPQLSGYHQSESDSTLAFGEELKGTFLFARTALYSSPQMADYRAAVKKYQPKGELGGFGATAWVMGKLVERRVAPLLAEPASSQQVIQGMLSLKNETLDGLLPGITFPPPGQDRVHVNLCSVPIQIQPGAFVPAKREGSFVCAPGWKPAG